MACSDLERRTVWTLGEVMMLLDYFMHNRRSAIEVMRNPELIKAAR